jgi:hypothetical protein
LCNTEAVRGRKYAIIFGLVLLLVGIFWGYRYYFDDFEVRTDPANPDSYPFVSWQAVVDGGVCMLCDDGETKNV